MDSHTHPKDRASLLSKALCFWLIKFIVLTKKLDKSEDPLLDIPQTFGLDLSCHLLEENWSKEVKQPKPNFYNALIRTYGKEFILDLLPLTISIFCNFGIALLIGELIFCIYHSTPIWQGLIISISITLLSILSAIETEKSYIVYKELAVKIRSNSITLILKKLLNKSYISINSELTTAHISNIIGSDMHIFFRIAVLPYLLLLPVFISTATLLLWYKLGLAGVLAQILMIFNAPVLLWISKSLNKYKSRIFTLSDKRMKTLINYLEGIQVAKFLNWCSAINIKISIHRKAELIQHFQKSILKVVSFTIVSTFQGLIILFAYWCATKFGIVLRLETVFCAISILMSSHFYLSAGVTESVSVRSYLLSTCVGITNILLSEDYVGPRVNNLGSIQLMGITSSWHNLKKSHKSIKTNTLTDSSPDFLNDINLFIRPGKLYAIIGQMSSGKSMLLHTILGECNITQGEIVVGGSIAYASQEPWIVSGTVRENIIMGSPYIKEKYNQVIQCCDLQKDLNGMTNNDDTDTGIKGNSLSGGQRLRISLARAVYANKDIYLIDDPFSALDVKLCRNILDHCIKEHLSEKTRLVVINDLGLLPDFENVIIMNNGQIEYIGTYSELSNDENWNVHVQPLLRKSKPKRHVRRMTIAPDKQKDRAFISEISEKKDKFESTKKGTIQIKLLYRFLIFGFKSVFGLGFFILGSFVVQFFSLAMQYWVSYWSLQDEEEQKNSYYPIVLLIIVCLAIVLTLIRNLILFAVLFSSSNRLHYNTIKSISEASIEFFQVNSSGSILNVLSSDFNQIDEYMIPFFANVVVLGLIVLGYIIAIVIMVPANLIFIVIIFITAILLGNSLIGLIVKANRKYLSSNSPLVTLTEEYIAGIISLRCYNLQSYFISLLEENLNDSSAKYLNLTYLLHFYVCCIGIFGGISLGLNCFFIIIFLSRNNADFASLSLTFSLSITSFLSWGIKELIQVFSIMACVQRIESIIQAQHEESPINDNFSINEGNVQFNEVSLIYPGSYEFALSNISFSIPSGTKLAIVGRSGSGKSSIINVLLRLNKLQSGIITIDDQNIFEVSIESLRDKISIIPQSPFIFAGSVRDNLDPYHRICEAELIRVLKIVGLDRAFTDEPLKYELGSNSSTLSIGEKQLFCLARVLLKNNKILVLDEATAFVNQKEQEKMNNAIITHFRRATIISVVHKMDFISEYDLLMLVDNGFLIEIMKPNEFLTRPPTCIQKVRRRTIVTDIN
ncbi:hypothetical protein SteCoe_31852 [Stentor coeruleus]|uniref:ABC transporter domain-containing protein n=1 Tax=Stentor coeruleus TaxID=5963 RepID=A0A1R2B0D0_9CILI|nr:hypothetical protein SteCoe_31852 [Stentor coeruleus]